MRILIIIASIIIIIIITLIKSISIYCRDIYNKLAMSWYTLE